MTTPPPVPAAPPPMAAGRRSRLPFAVVVVIVIGVLVALAVANGAFRGSSSGSGASPSASTPGVVPPDAGVVAEGRAVPLERREVAFPSGGRVAEVPVRPGDAVGAGDVLVLLDATAAEEELASAQAGVAAANAAVDGAEASVRQAQANVDAARAAVDQAQASRRAADAARDQLPSGASSAAERQANAEVAGASAGVDAARAQLAGARAALETAEASAAGARADQERATSAADAAQVAKDQLWLRAPISGTVVSVDVARGDVVQPGAVVVRVADLSEWRFETSDLSESSVARIAVGQPVAVTVDGLPGDEIAGTVESVGGYGTSSQGDIVFDVVVAPTDAVPAGLRWNMTVTLEIDTGA